MSNFDLLKDAIKNKEVVSFTYDGFSRVVEPFVLGDTHTMRHAIRAYQTAGGSSSGNVSGWHLFLLDKILWLSKTGEHFDGEREDYSPSDKGMLRIYAHV